MDSMERMRELVAQLNAASRAYYAEARPVMSDFEYDRLYDELAALERETGRILAQSPTQQVGYQVVTALPKVRHEKRMLSLDKTKDVERLQSWLGEQEGLLSWKLDGLTIVLRYENGALAQAVTRGNGEVGEDITHNARTFEGLPLSIPFSGRLILRGEGVIPYGWFQKINETLPDEEKYKNPRNLCSGTVRQLNSEICARRHVNFLAFTLVEAEGYEPVTRQESLDFLQTQGFMVVEHRLVNRESLPGAVTDFEAAIGQNPFASDGLVLTYNSIAYGASLGETAKFPRDSIAFKWADETAETRLLSIHWDTSRTGLINPVAVFSPVELEGSTVSRASVHNLSVLEELKLGIGDHILVYKANMIIPQIAKNLTQSGPEAPPALCPVCGGETEVRQLREGKFLYCTNPTCRAQRVRALTHFVSRDAANVDGLSEETIKKFVDAGFLEQYPDLYALDRYGEQIVAMEGFGEKSWANLQAALEKSRRIALPHLIYALGINQVGLANAKLLCRYFHNDPQAILGAQPEELTAIDGFGEVIAHSVYQYFHELKNRALFNRALKIFTLEAEDEPADTGLSGQVFVITGDLRHFPNRKALQAAIEARGGKVTGSVSQKTTCLINNDSQSGSAKNQKARALGIPVVTEDEFLERFLPREGE